MIGEEMSSDESVDDDELCLVVWLKQHGFTLILAVLLIGLFSGDGLLDFVIESSEINRD